MEFKEVLFEIRRQPTQVNSGSDYDSFPIKVTPGLSVLEALISIQEHQDPSLAFRFSCRGAVCGACAMLINKEIKLACRTQIHDLKSKKVKLEPLTNLPVIKDLVVDMTEFWRKYEYVKPWLEPKDDHPHNERLMNEELRVQLEPYANCILCAACYGACPVLGRAGAKNFLGPAALAKNYRFYIDSREGDRFERLELVNDMDGIWGCDTFFRCVKFCPKDVRPAHGIISSRKKITGSNLLGKSKNSQGKDSKRAQKNEVSDL